MEHGEFEVVSPRRIAVVTETYPPEVNGVAMTIGRMVAALRVRGHAVEVARPRQNGRDHPSLADEHSEILLPGLAIPRYSELKMGLPAKSALLRRWRVRRPDLVHVVTEGPLGWSAVSAARALAIPVSSDFHTRFDSYSRHYGIGWLKAPIAAYLRAFHNRAQLTMVPTGELCSQLAAEGFRNLAIVSRGVDTELFNPARRDPELRRRWGAPELAVIYVGRLAAEKNLALLMQAFERIRSAHPGAQPVLVGAGPLKRELERQYPEFYFAGMQTGEALAAHYASADLFLFPSLTETFGNVTLEAMASGLAVLAFDYGAAREHISSGVNGELVPYLDQHRFLCAAERLAADPVYAQALGQRARKSAEGLGWHEVFTRLEAQFARLLASAAKDG